MAFVTGLMLIDAPASALNNLGNIIGERDENTVGVKVIKTREGYYPYVSAQAFRYWLRTTAQARVEGWRAAPIHYKGNNVAYTDSNPIEWWDDDLFGYMRAPAKKQAVKEERSANASQLNETETLEPITRISPFRVSTLVSIAPAFITDDFGVMARQEEYPVLHRHQFYRTTLRGIYSLDLHACGTFSYRNKAGYRNLDGVRIDIAKKERLEHLEDEKAYRLPLNERVRRVQGLFDGLALLEGGAKQTIHYTDVSPALSILAITRDGNHIFGHVVGPNTKELPEIKLQALREALTTMSNDILSPVYVGWVRGYLDEERKKFEAFIADFSTPSILIHHPRDAYRQFVADLALPENANWLA